MTRINCRSVRREIEEADTVDLLSSGANEHINSCAPCETFGAEQMKLREIVAGLGTVEAPGDFDFRLRARLAGEKRGAAQPFAMRSFSFGFRSAAFSTVVLLVGSALLFLSLRSPSDNSLSANDAKPASNRKEVRVVEPKDVLETGSQGVAVTPQTNPAGLVDAKLNSPNSSAQRDKRRLRFAEVASLRDARRLRVRDQSSTQAAVLRPGDITATPSVFPIGASYQSLKVSLDDGRGSSRTISLPTISFGSQRVLAQSRSPLMASARGDW